VNCTVDPCVWIPIQKPRPLPATHVWRTSLLFRHTQSEHPGLWHLLSEACLHPQWTHRHSNCTEGHWVTLWTIHVLRVLRYHCVNDTLTHGYRLIAGTILSDLVPRSVYGYVFLCFFFRCLWNPSMHGVVWPMKPYKLPLVCVIISCRTTCRSIFCFDNLPPNQLIFLRGVPLHQCLVLHVLCKRISSFSDLLYLQFLVAHSFCADS